MRAEPSCRVVNSGNPQYHDSAMVLTALADVQMTQPASAILSPSVTVPLGVLPFGPAVLRNTYVWYSSVISFLGYY